MIHNAGEQRCEYCRVEIHQPEENNGRYNAQPDKHKTGCPVQAITGKDYNELSWHERKYWPAYKINPYRLIYWNRGWTSGFAGDQEPKNHYSNGFCPNSFRLGWQMGNATIEDAANAAAENNYSYHRDEY